MIRLPFYARFAFTLLSIVLSVYLLKLGSRIFIPLVFALLLAIFLYPVCIFLERKVRLGRFLSALLPVVMFVSAFTIFAYFMIIQVVGFSRDFPTLRKRFSELFVSFQDWLSYKLQIDSVQQSNYINSSVKGFVENIAASLSTVFVSLTASLIFGVFVLMFSFFMLFHRKLLMNFILRVFAPANRDKVWEVVMATKYMINSYVLGLVIETMILSVILCSLLFVLGVQYPLLLGVLAAVLNIIPYLGVYVSIGIVMLVTLGNGTGTLAMQAGVGMFIVHVLEANILMPKIVGARVKMNPFITIVAVIIGEEVWGIPGMFLFIPLTGMVKLVCDRIEGLSAWGLLIGVEENHKSSITSEIVTREPDLRPDSPAHDPLI